MFKVIIKILLLTYLFSFILIIYFFIFKLNQKLISRKIEEVKELNYNVKFDYCKYENNIITKKMIKKAGWQLELVQAYFINGLIRKIKPKNCLEIGVSNGGSSILILNAIKDIEDSFLISLDLNTQMYLHKDKKTGYRVQQFFPELSKKWTLFTGDLPHKFLVQLNKTFDFLFLDTAHMAPGELLNFIEVLPFLKEKAIVIIHDLLWHFNIKVKFYPSNVYLFPNIRGDKILLRNNKGELSGIGGIFLYPNQKKYYLNYFLLLLCFWEYIPTDKQINDMVQFIKKYYNNEIYLQIFNIAVKKNKNSIIKLSNYNFNNNNMHKHIMKTLGDNKKYNYK